MWRWIGQVVSGGLLLVLVTVHMVANHFVVKGGLRTYAQVADYIANPVMLAIEVAFLLVVTWHAMAGIHAVLGDLGLRGRGERVATRVLTGLGLGTVAYGLWLVTTITRSA
jgi:succinate dehydrogenase membrane anchor subunit